MGESTGVGLRVRADDPVPEPWERYRELVWDEHMAHRAGFAQRPHDRPFDPGIRAAAGVLAERFKMLAPRIAAGGADEDVVRQAEELLQDLEELRDQRCARGGSDWEDLQRRCADLMILLARIANAQGRPGQARDWFRRAAAAWRDLGETAWVQECLLDAESASLANGGHVEAVLETLDSWLSERPPPVRRAKLLARTARILVDAGDYAAARPRADEAAGMMDAAGFTDPVAAGSAEEAFAAWVATDHREPVPGLPWLQVQPLFGGVATIWETLTELRLLLGTLPRPQVLRALDDIDALRRRLLREASAVGRQIEFAVAALRGMQSDWARPMDGDATADNPARSYRQLGDRHRRLAALHDEAQHAVPGSAEVDLLLARMADLGTC